MRERGIETEIWTWPSHDRNQSTEETGKYRSQPDQTRFENIYVKRAFGLHPCERNPDKGGRRVTGLVGLQVLIEFYFNL